MRWRHDDDPARARRAVAGITILALAALVAGCSGADPDADAHPAGPAFPKLAGPWLGQTPPGDEPEVFAPGLVSTGMHVRDMASTPEGDELFYTVMLPNFEHSVILTSRLEDGFWTRPEVAPFSGRYKDLEPAISADGTRLYFVSFRPESGTGAAREDSDIWIVERTADGWGEPANPGAPLNSEQSEFFPSPTRDGAIWFTRETDGRDSVTWRSRFVDGSWTEPERLPEEINAGPLRFNVFVAPDESYAILPIYGLEDSLGATDYYVSFRDDDGAWSGPFHLGERVNSAGGAEYSAYVSPDGAYLFFMASRGKLAAGVAETPVTYDDLLRFHEEPGYGNPSIWWVRADFLEELRPNAGPTD